MPFTTGEREELAATRMRVLQLEAKERTAAEDAACVLITAGLMRTNSETSWLDVLSRHAEAIRDALEPFDSGYRVAQADE